MPFRLLGMVADPDHASALCGQTFARYAAAGVDITLACASGDHLTTGRLKTIRALGVRSVVSLGFATDELDSADLESVLADLMLSLQPHVVVTEGPSSPLDRAAASAFHRVRRPTSSSSLPARLYCRASAAAPVQVTTRINTISRPTEYFSRLHPAPWVTGVLETDLFSGVPLAAAEANEQQLAS